MARRVIYTSDRGDRYEVSKMETSHLINAIGHHLRQIQTLRAVPPRINVGDRIRVLDEVILVLHEELETRVPDITEYFSYGE